MGWGGGVQPNNPAAHHPQLDPRSRGAHVNEETQDKGVCDNGTTIRSNKSEVTVRRTNSIEPVASAGDYVKPLKPHLNRVDQ